MKKMPNKNPEIFIYIIVMATLGTIANYAYKVLMGEKFSWISFFLQAFISIFAGALVLMAALYYEWRPELAGGISGLAGWSGASLVKTLEKRLLNKVGGED